MKVCPPTVSSTTRSVEAGPPSNAATPSRQAPKIATSMPGPGSRPSAYPWAATPVAVATPASANARGQRSVGASPGCIAPSSHVPSAGPSDLLLQLLHAGDLGLLAHRHVG